MIQIQNKVLQPYFAAAIQGDWYPPLHKLIQETPPQELKKVLSESESELQKLAFAFPETQIALLQFYLGRIRTLAKRGIQPILLSA